MTLEFVNNYIDEKIAKNDEQIVFTFFELRIKCNLTEEDTDKFLELAKNKFENMNYQVFFTGAKYNYKGKNNIVQDNELMIALKEEQDK